MFSPQFYSRALCSWERNKQKRPWPLESKVNRACRRAYVDRTQSGWWTQSQIWMIQLPQPISDQPSGWLLSGHLQRLATQGSIAILGPGSWIFLSVTTATTCIVSKPEVWGASGCPGIYHGTTTIFLQIDKTNQQCARSCCRSFGNTIDIIIMQQLKDMKGTYRKAFGWHHLINSLTEWDVWLNEWANEQRKNKQMSERILNKRTTVIFKKTTIITCFFFELLASEAKCTSCLSRVFSKLRLLWP